MSDQETNTGSKRSKREREEKEEKQVQEEAGNYKIIQSPQKINQLS